MSTTTATRPSTRLKNDGEKPILNHVFYAEDLTRAIVTGEQILAICGYIGHVYGQGGGKMTRRTRGVLVVCEDCKRIYNSLGPLRA